MIGFTDAFSQRATVRGPEPATAADVDGIMAVSHKPPRSVRPSSSARQTRLEPSNPESLRISCSSRRTRWQTFATRRGSAPSCSTVAISIAAPSTPCSPRQSVRPTRRPPGRSRSRRLRNESFTSAPQLMRGPLGGGHSDWPVLDAGLVHQDDFRPSCATEALMCRDLLALVILLICPSHVPAQTAVDTPSVSPGARVRITTDSSPGPRLVGTFAGYRADTLWLQVGASPLLPVPRSRVLQLEVSRGQRSYWRLGATVGFVLGTAVGVLTTQGKTYAFGDDTPYIQILGGMFVGTALGAGIGSSVHRDRWEILAWAPPGRISWTLPRKVNRRATLRCSTYRTLRK